MKTQAGMAWLARSGIAAALTFGGAAPAHARITRIEIARVESPAFGGAAFRSVGPTTRSSVARLLLQADADAVIAQADASSVLR